MSEVKKVLTREQRKKLPKGVFCIPEKAPGPGSYPIPDRQHAISALAYAKKYGVSDKVKPCVCKRYPDLDACKE